MRTFLAIEATAEFIDQLEDDPNAALLPCWQALEKHDDGEVGSYPVETRLVLVLATALGFDLTPRMLAHYVQKSHFTPPPRFGGMFAWRAEDIARLFGFLFERRKFLPGRWWSEKTDHEKKRDNAEAETSLRMLDHLSKLSDHELEKLMQETKTSPMREMVHRALTARQEEKRAAHSMN